MVVNKTSVDHDLPWDKMWEYVLGDGGDDNSAYSMAIRQSSRLSSFSLPVERPTTTQSGAKATSVDYEADELSKHRTASSSAFSASAKSSSFSSSSTTQQQQQHQRQPQHSLLASSSRSDSSVRQSSSTTNNNNNNNNRGTTDASPRRRRSGDLPPRPRSASSSLQGSESSPLLMIHTTSSSSKSVRKDTSSGSSPIISMGRSSSTLSEGPLGVRNKPFGSMRKPQQQQRESGEQRQESAPPERDAHDEEREMLAADLATPVATNKSRKLTWFQQRPTQLDGGAVEKQVKQESAPPLSESKSNRSVSSSNKSKSGEQQSQRGPAFFSSPTTQSTASSLSRKRHAHRVQQPEQPPQQPTKATSTSPATTSTSKTTKTSSLDSKKQQPPKPDEEASAESAAVVEERYSGSPDTTLETDYSIDGPLAALFLTCNNNDNLSFEGGTTTDAQQIRKHNKERRTAASLAAALQGKIGTVHTCMAGSTGSVLSTRSSLNNKNKSSNRTGQSGNSDGASSSSSSVSESANRPTTPTISSGVGGLLFFDSIAKGIDDFLDPAFSYSFDDPDNRNLCASEFSSDNLSVSALEQDHHHPQQHLQQAPSKSNKGSSSSYRKQSSSSSSSSRRLSLRNGSSSSKKKELKLYAGDSRSGLSPINEELSPSAERDTSYEDDVVEAARRDDDETTNDDDGEENAEAGEPRASLHDAPTDRTGNNRHKERRHDSSSSIGYDLGGSKLSSTSSRLEAPSDGEAFASSEFRAFADGDFVVPPTKKDSRKQQRKASFAGYFTAKRRDKDDDSDHDRDPDFLSFMGARSGLSSGFSSNVAIHGDATSPRSTNSQAPSVLFTPPTSPISHLSGLSNRATTTGIRQLSPTSTTARSGITATTTGEISPTSATASQNGLRTTTSTALVPPPPTSSSVVSRTELSSVATGPVFAAIIGGRRVRTADGRLPSYPPSSTDRSGLFVDPTATNTIIGPTSQKSPNSQNSLMTVATKQHIGSSSRSRAAGTTHPPGQSTSSVGAPKKALLVTQQNTDSSASANGEAGKVSIPKISVSFSRSSWDDIDNDRQLLYGKGPKKQDQQKEQHRSCLRLPICFGGNRKSFEQVFTFTNSDLGESRELSAQDTANLFPKSRLIPSSPNSLTAKDSSSKGTMESRQQNQTVVEEETGGYLQDIRSPTQRSGIHSLYEYEYDLGVHMSVVFDDFGSNPEEQLRVLVHEAPPEKNREGLIEYNKVVIKVEASTVSTTDCALRSGKLAHEFNLSAPATPGVDVIGKIYRIDGESSANYKLKVGDRVMSLIKWGGNSRYLTVDPSKLVKVSDDLDPAEAVCLVETYLHAFQLVHCGQSKTTRYRKNALQDKRILVVGELASNIGKAIVELANLAGCRNIVGTVAEKHYETVTKMGVIPIDPEPLNWKSFLNGSVDLLIQLNGRLSPTVAYGVLRPTGSMVISTSYSKADERLGPAAQAKMVAACGKPDLSLDARVTRYNVFRSWDDNREYVQDDLRHLTSLLEERKLVPEVLDRISLSSVAKAHSLLESRRLRGFFVCEPWLVSKSRTLNI
ncbi:hypothetical protein ACA910_005603 [Epithemia clementina (nom. ined.)]